MSLIQVARPIAPHELAVALCHGSGVTITIDITCRLSSTGYTSVLGHNPGFAQTVWIISRGSESTKGRRFWRGPHGFRHSAIDQRYMQICGRSPPVGQNPTFKRAAQ